MTTKVSFGEGIRLLRLQHKLTQEECARWWGCTPKTWIAWEKGENDHFRAALFNYFLLALERGVLGKK